MTQIHDIRVLAGPNPDVAGPAIRLSVVADWADVERVAGAVIDAASRIGMPLERSDLVIRPTDDGFVVAWPVPDRSQAELHASVVEALLRGSTFVATETARPHRAFDLLNPHVPCVAISGTNGKTTTTRLIAHCARTAGLSTAWSSTDGVFRDGELIEAGDYSGPGGARRVLAEPEIGFAVLETARGGLLLRGMSVQRVDVAVVTNVAADHLGSHGINTVEQLAMVKATVVRVADADGWVVLNADEPLVRRMAEQSSAPVWFFGLGEPEGSRFTGLRDGHVVVTGDVDIDLGPIADMPVTVAGRARFNVLNVLAAASAALAAGVPEEHVRTALREFRPDSALSSGRFNCWQVRGRRVILDMAHNVESLRELLTTAAALTDGQVWVAFGTAGDREDEVLQGMGFTAADLADHAYPMDKPRYLRDRSAEQMRAQFLAGMAVAGAEAEQCFDSEVQALQTLVERANDGDVVVVTIAEQLPHLEQWLRLQSAVEVDPGQWVSS